jgi:hypothetical protein
MRKKHQNTEGWLKQKRLTFSEKQTTFISQPIDYQCFTINYSTHLDYKAKPICENVSLILTKWALKQWS